MSARTRSQKNSQEQIFEQMPVPKAVLTLAVPTVISQLIVLIYNLADTWFIGQTGDLDSIKNRIIMYLYIAHSESAPNALFLYLFLEEGGTEKSREFHETTFTGTVTTCFIEQPVRNEGFFLYRRCYDDYILLDFALETMDTRRNFEDNIGDLDTFFRNLFIIKGKDLPRRRSVIISDEVQLFPTARQAIKYLVADGRYDYIETGSLISIKKNVRNILIPSEEEKLKMFPMDFEEFLWAKGNTVTMPVVKSAFESRKPLGDAAHRKIMQLFREYIPEGWTARILMQPHDSIPYNHDIANVFY